MIKKISFLFIFLLVFAGKSVLADGLDHRYIDDLEKEWMINFNMVVESDSVNKETIFVRQGNRILDSINVSLHSPQTVNVKNNEVYKTGEYELVITTDVKSTNGRNLNDEVILPFTIIEKETKQDMEIHFLDVGQGDSTLIITPNGSTILIDAGTATAGQKVVSYLKQAGVSTIDKLVMTHPHADHIGGAVEVMRNFEIGKVIDSGAIHTSQTYMNYLLYIDENDISFEVAVAGNYLDIDPNVEIKVVNSGKNGDSLNDASVSLHFTYNDFTFLITGDAEVKAEQRIVDNYNLKADVLRVGHHGSRSSTNQFFLDAFQPKDAIFSYGERNSYEHPHQEVVDRLQAANVNMFSTVYSGDVVLTTDGEIYTIDAVVTPIDILSKGGSSQEPVVISPININTADFDLLQEITGVGPAIAERIIDYRELIGGFDTIDQIKNVSGIGDARFDSMKDEITVGEN